jgi:hypothetical protein
MIVDGLGAGALYHEPLAVDHGRQIDHWPDKIRGYLMGHDSEGTGLGKRRSEVLLTLN